MELDRSLKESLSKGDTTHLSESNFKMMSLGNIAIYVNFFVAQTKNKSKSDYV